MQSQYLYSELNDPDFRHIIRCEPRSTMSHEEGILWLRGLASIPPFLGMEPEADFRKLCLTMFAFKTKENATLFYCSAYGDLGQAA